MEDNSILETKKDAINLNISSGKRVDVGTIEIKQGATLKSHTGAGIKINPNNNITGNINIQGKIEAKTGIINEGNVGGSIITSSDSPLLIENRGDGNIGAKIESTGKGGVNISNTGSGKIQEDVINSGSGNLNLNNKEKALLGANIVNNGNGNLSISNTGKISDNTKVVSNGSRKINVAEGSPYPLKPI